MSMYLRVNIPYRYALPKSPTDPAIVDVFPLMDRTSPFSDHITLSLTSLQTPWSQINKKNEVFTFDPETAFYPAYLSTSKIRPKMIPQTVSLLSTSFASVSDIFKLQGSTPHDIRADGFTTYADREKHFQAEREKELKGLYRAYKPFLDTKTLSVPKMMDWAATQDDLIGVWNQGRISADVMGRTTQKTYRLANHNEGQEGIKRSEWFLKTISQTDADFVVESEDLGLSYSQKVLGFAPYATTLEGSDTTIHRPVSLRYRFVSEMEDAKQPIKHSDAGSWTTLTYNPPSLDWEGAGFPKIAPTKTKALYARQPVQLNTSYGENGFTRDASLLLQRCWEESQAPATWFANLVEPIDPDGDVVPLFRHLQGKVIEWSALSWMERKYRTEGKVVWKTQNYDAMGYGLRYRLVSNNSQWINLHSRHRNFPTGSTRNFSWDNIPIDSRATRRYGATEWFWDRRGGKSQLVGLSDLHSQAARAAGYANPLPAPRFEDERVYPALDYKIDTSPELKGVATDTMGRGTRQERLNTGLVVLPTQITAFRDNGDRGRLILAELLNSGLMLTTYAHDPSQSNQGMNATLIQDLLEAALITRPGEFQVQVENRGMVSITQKLSRQEIIKTLTGESNWEWIATGLQNGEKKGVRWDYKVYFLIHPDGRGVSILLTYPTFLNNPFPRAIQDGRGTAIKINSPNLFLLRGYDKEVIGIENGNMNTSLPFTLSPREVGKDASDPLDPVVGDEIMEYINTTAFGGYQYCLLHLRDGMTLSDPANTLPITYKRGKLSVEDSFTYTSPIPVIGEELTTLAPVQINAMQEANRRAIKVAQVEKPAWRVIPLEYSPVARYTISPSEDNTQLSLPTYEFKAQNANSRMNKYRRSGRRNSRRLGYSDGTRPNDYRIYSQFILPFGDFTSGCRQITTNQYFSEVGKDFYNYLRTRSQQFPDTAKDEDLKLPVAASPIRRRKTTARQKYGSELPMNLGVWNIGVPTTIVPETYSLVGRELGIINWLTLS